MARGTSATWMAVAFGALLWGGGGGAPATAFDGWESADQPLKAFAVKDVDGRTLESRTLKGKVVVFDFWATWCTPCVQELPDLEAYRRKIAGRSDVALLSLNVTEDAETVRAFMKRKALSPPVYLGDDLLGPLQVSQFPTKLIVDLRREGVVRFRREGGPVPLASLEQRVAQALADKR